MTKYREILRLSNLGLSQQSIADSCGVSKKTVNCVHKKAKELNLFWPLDANDTDAVLADKLFPSADKPTASNKRMPDFAYIRKELLRNGVSKKLLWTEYMEDCRANGAEPLMYSQFCYHIQQDEQKHRATMHISRKPGEQVEVDWAGDPVMVIDLDTGESLKAYVFVGVMTYSQYAYVESFLDMKQRSWLSAHVHIMNDSAALPKSWCRITARLPLSTMAAGKTSRSMRPIRKWRSIMEQPLSRPVSGLQRTNLMRRGL